MGNTKQNFHKNSIFTKKSTLCFLLIAFLITMSTLTYLDVKQVQPERNVILKILTNAQENSDGSIDLRNQTKFLLLNLPNQSQSNNAESERIVRQIAKQIINGTVTGDSANSYYEEQEPVLVHAESLKTPVMGVKSSAIGPPFSPFGSRLISSDSDETADSDSSYDDDGRGFYDDYSSFRNDNEDDDGYRNNEQFSRSSNEGSNAETMAEGRSAQNRPFDGYYRQWHYEEPIPPDMSAQNRRLQQSPPWRNDDSESNPYAIYEDGTSDYDYAQQPVSNDESNQSKQKFSSTKSQQQQQYLPLQYRQQLQRQQQQQQQQQSNSNDWHKSTQNQPTMRSTTLEPARIPQSNGNSESPILGVMKNLKTMWDIYQALSSAWNKVAEHQQEQQKKVWQQQQLLREKMRRRRLQQKGQMNQSNQEQKEPEPGTRVNSKRPSNLSGSSTNTTNSANKKQNASKESQETIETSTKPTKKPRRTSTTTTRTTTTATTPINTERIVTITPATTWKTTTTTRNPILDLPPASVEPRHASNSKGESTYRDLELGLREKRQSSGTMLKPDESEGRYIKGDPLKGYYDFVITEGSYKFWAAFQVGTAVLIIYSVFAAIYYSKVNPLVSDYDYIDYLGGGRSLSGGDLDFVDDDSGDSPSRNMTSASWYNGVMPRVGHSIKFILDAIDKLPVDHTTAEKGANDEGNDNRDFESESAETIDL